MDAIVPASLQRMQMDGVVYRRLAGAHPRAAAVGHPPRRHLGGSPSFPGSGEEHGADLPTDRPSGRCPLEPFTLIG
jgi:hypothetical protein